MARAHLKISVPKPCSESWAAMTPEGKGRHCASCATTVVDFSQFTGRQLLEYLQQNPGKKCGRFSVQQLERPVYLEPQPAAGFWPKVAAGLVLLIGISAQAKAQVNLGLPVPTNEVVPEKSQSTAKVGEVVTNSGESNAAEKGGRVIFGRLIDDTTKEPIMFGNVLVKGTTHYGMSDNEGNFKIVLPDTFNVKEIVLVTPNVGYFTKETLIQQESLGALQNICLIENGSALSGEIVIVKYRKTPKYYFRKFWWGTKNFLGIRENGMVTGEVDEAELAE